MATIAILTRIHPLSVDCGTLHFLAITPKILPPYKALHKKQAREDIKSHSASEALTNMNILLLEVGIPLLVVLVAVIIYLAFPRIKGLHYTSRLTCPKCGKQFDYEWVPGGSFSAVRLGHKRYMSCPNCHQWSTFEIWKTKIEETKTTQKVTGQANHAESN